MMGISKKQNREKSNPLVDKEIQTIEVRSSIETRENPLSKAPFPHFTSCVWVMIGIKNPYQLFYWIRVWPPLLYVYTWGWFEKKSFLRGPN